MLLLMDDRSDTEDRGHLQPPPFQESTYSVRVHKMGHTVIPCYTHYPRKLLFQAETKHNVLKVPVNLYLQQSFGCGGQS